MLPLVSALAITLGLRRSRTLTTTLSLSSVAVGFAPRAWLFLVCAAPGAHAAGSPLAWLSVPGLDIHLGLTVDSLSTLMLMVVTGVSFLVHLYSTGYMADDAEYPRYFSTLGFFTFSMLGIVLSDNFVQTFIFWELV
ncbi:MAG: NADH-quinone oxidoreductase subunit L, partial [Planctomycetota bacterium]|nr:NADH-quinone oxidoreductase subunit L [Planctomycetota bacterium]